MRLRRRRFMHLMPSAGAAALIGCNSDSSSDDDDDDGGGSTGTPGDDDDDDDDDDDATTGGASTGGADESTGGTGEEIDCEESWWLCGNYGPVDEADTEDLEVEGTIPGALSGLYARNGPNPMLGHSGHWFVGDGMVHGVRLDRGSAVSYRARYVQTDILGVRPDPDAPIGPPGLTDHQANTALLWHGERMLALLEAGLPYELDPTDLKTVGPYDFGGALNGPMTAHPKIDPDTGELVFFGYHILESSAHVHFASADGTHTRTEIVELAAPTMMHEFQITERYVVLLDFPVAFDLDLAAGGSPLPFRWQPELGARIGLMPRNGTGEDATWYEVDLGFIFHTFNAYDDPENDGRVIIDAVYYSQTWVEGPNDFDTDGDVVRYVIDTMRGTVTQEVVDGMQVEFPRVDPRRAGRRYRYGYAVGGSRPPEPGMIRGADSIVKFDRQGGTVTHTLEGGAVIDEVVYVPDSPGSGEDEGWLVGYAYLPDRDTSRLMIFDATDIQAGPAAQVHLPSRVPHGFHGTFIPRV